VKDKPRVDADLRAFLGRTYNLNPHSPDEAAIFSAFAAVLS